MDFVYKHFLVFFFKVVITFIILSILRNFGPTETMVNNKQYKNNIILNVYLLAVCIYLV